MRTDYLVNSEWYLDWDELPSDIRPFDVLQDGELIEEHWDNAETLAEYIEGVEEV